MSPDFGMGLAVGVTLMTVVALAINVVWYREARRLNEDWYEIAKRGTDGWKATIADWQRTIDAWKASSERS